MSTDKKEIVPFFSNKIIYYLWLNNWESTGFFSVDSSSTGALGSCINVLFLIISI